MRKILFASLITAAVMWLVIGGCRCNPKEPDNTVTSWKHFIPKDSALILIRRLAAIDSNGVIRKSQLSKSYLYNDAKSMMRNMMMRDNCSGIRVYYGLSLTNKIVPIICGVTSRGDDIYWQKPLPKNEKATIVPGSDSEEGLCDMSQPEPPPPSASSIYLAF